MQASVSPPERNRKAEPQFDGEEAVAEEPRRWTAPRQHIDAISQRAGGAAPRRLRARRDQRAQPSPTGSAVRRRTGQDGERGHDHRTDAAGASGIHRWRVEKLPRQPRRSGADDLDEHEERQGHDQERRAAEKRRSPPVARSLQSSCPFLEPLRDRRRGPW